MTRSQVVQSRVVWWQLSATAAILFAGIMSAFVQPGLILAIILFGGVLALSLANPPLIIRMTVLFLLTVNPILANYVPPVIGILIKEVLLAISLMVWTVHLLKHRRLLKYKGEIAIILFALLTFFSGILQHGIQVGVIAWRTTALYAFVYFAARDLFSKRKDILRYVSMVRQIASATVIVQILQFLLPNQIMPLMGWEYGVDQAWRGSGLGLRAPGFTTGAHTGLFLATVLAMELGLLIQAKRPYDKRFLINKLAFLALMLGGILLTASRGTLVGVALGVIYLVFRLRAVLKVVPLALVGALLSVIVFGDYALDVVGSLWGRTSSVLLVESVRARQQIYGSMMQSFLNAPIFGHGLTVAGQVKLGVVGGLLVQHPHSYILKLLVQTGLVGLGTWLIMLALMIGRADRIIDRGGDRQRRMLGISVVAALLSLIGCNLFNELLEDPAINVLFWSLLGVLSAIVGLHRTNERGDMSRGTL